MFKSKYIKLLIITILIVLVFIASEALFIYRNRYRLVETYYIFRAQHSVDKDIAIATNLLLKGLIKFHPLENNNHYPQEFSTTMIDLPKNDELAHDFERYIKNTQLITLYEQEVYSYPRIFYDLALIAYRNNEPQLFINLLQLATLHDVDMSYWPVELANYYYSINDNEKAYDIFEKCKQNPTTKIHCTETEDYLEEGNASFEIGFLLRDTEKMLGHRSILEN